MEYLYPNGMTATDHYNLYLEKCRHFKEKAKTYEQKNKSLKKSLEFHIVKLGYEPSEETERQMLETRENQLEFYKKKYNPILFGKDINEMFECTEVKSKKIRVIRELSQEQNKTLSEDFEKGNNCWFKRFRILLKFVQAARAIIIRNRLLKNLKILKQLTPDIVKIYEKE